MRNTENNTTDLFKISLQAEIKTSELDRNIYEKGIKVIDKNFKKINIVKDSFHGEWNYTIRPNHQGQV